MPSRIRLDHSITGHDLDALFEDEGGSETSLRRPAWGPLAGVNAYGPTVARLWPALIVAGVLLLLVGLATRGIANAPQMDAPVSQVLEVAPPTPAIDYAAQPSMRIWCDGTPVDLVSARQVTTELTRTCWTDYGWCHECQLAWMDAHP